MIQNSMCLFVMSADEFVACHIFTSVSYSVHGGPGCRSLSGGFCEGQWVSGYLWQRPTPDTSTTVPVMHPSRMHYYFNFVHRHLWRYTLIDRPRHHYLQTLVAWCSWCWTIRCLSSFNYVNMRQSTYTNTKSKSYLRTDSYCCRDTNKCNLSEIIHTTLEIKLIILTVWSIYSGNNFNWIN